MWKSQVFAYATGACSLYEIGTNLIKVCACVLMVPSDNLVKVLFCV